MGMLARTLIQEGNGSVAQKMALPKVALNIRGASPRRQAPTPLKARDLDQGARVPSRMAALA